MRWPASEQAEREREGPQERLQDPGPHFLPRTQSHISRGVRGLRGIGCPEPRMRTWCTSCQLLSQSYLPGLLYGIPDWGGGRCWESEDIGSGPDLTNCQLSDLQQDTASSGPRFLITKVKELNHMTRLWILPTQDVCLTKHHFIIFNNHSALIISVLMTYLCFCSKLQP